MLILMLLKVLVLLVLVYEAGPLPLRWVDGVRVLLLGTPTDDHQLTLRTGTGC